MFWVLKIGQKMTQNPFRIGQKSCRKGYAEKKRGETRSRVGRGGNGKGMGRERVGNEGPIVGNWAPWGRPKVKRPKGQ